MENIYEINNLLKNEEPETILNYFVDKYKDRAALSSSFSIEDQVITHMIVSIKNNPKIFTLDTGRLPYETYSLIDRTREHYNIEIEVYFPNNNQTEKMVKEKGVNLFYNSVEDRKRCCYVRKIEPLKRALSNLDVWITGLRKEQSITRDNLKIVEYDENYNVIKVNPLCNWTEEKVWNYIKKNNVPYNQLYKHGFKSIGCAPCTRPVENGGNIRDGRWWWENSDTKECGLHIKSNIG